jgi:hypothetical protein
MTIVANPIPSRLSYACSACPACSCAERNAAQGPVTGVPGTLGTEAYPPRNTPGAVWARGGSVRENLEAILKPIDYAGIAAQAQAQAHRKDTFTRAEVLAILRSRKAIVQDVGVWAEHDKLITIFERME